jgi:hypothetical protein
MAVVAHRRPTSLPPRSRCLTSGILVGYGAVFGQGRCRETWMTFSMSG